MSKLVVTQKPVNPLLQKYLERCVSSRENPCRFRRKSSTAAGMLTAPYTYLGQPGLAPYLDKGVSGVVHHSGVTLV